MVSDQNDFNNHAYRRFLERIKVCATQNPTRSRANLAIRTHSIQTASFRQGKWASGHKNTAISVTPSTRPGRVVRANCEPLGRITKTGAALLLRATCVVE